MARASVLIKIMSILPNSNSDGLLATAHYLQSSYFPKKNFSIFNTRLIQNFPKEIDKNGGLENVLGIIHENFALLERSSTIYSLLEGFTKVLLAEALV